MRNNYVLSRLSGKGKKKPPQWFLLEVSSQAAEEDDRVNAMDVASPSATAGDVVVGTGAGDGDNQEKRRLAIIAWMELTPEEQEQRMAYHKTERRQQKEEKARLKREERAKAPCSGVCDRRNR